MGEQTGVSSPLTDAMSLSIESVAPDVVRLRMRSWQGAAAGYDVSAYVLRGVLVDTGFPRAGRALMRALATVRPRGAVVTHWHEDHAGNAALLAASGVPLLLHERCEATLRRPPHIAPYRRIVWGRTEPLVAPLLSFDPRPLEVIAMPGHSTDHLVVWDAERRVLVSGDLYLGGKVRAAHESESPRALLASLRRAAALEPELLLDAHRGPVKDATSRLRAKAAWLEETIGEIEAHAARGSGEREIARRVLGREALVGVVSFGEYSKLAFVGVVLREVSGEG